MHVVQPHFAVVHSSVGVPQLPLSLPQRFHLAAGQHDAALEGLEDVVIVPGFPVLGDRTGTGGLRGHEVSTLPFGRCCRSPTTSTPEWSATAMTGCPSRPVACSEARRRRATPAAH